MLANGRVAGTTPSLSVYISHVSSYCYCIVARHFPISSAPPVRFIIRHRREVVHTEFAMVCRDFRTCTHLRSIRRSFIYFCKFRYSNIITVIIYEKRILLLQNPRLKRNKNRNNERSIKNIRKILFFPLASTEGLNGEVIAMTSNSRQQSLGLKRLWGTLRLRIGIQRAKANLAFCNSHRIVQRRKG